MRLRYRSILLVPACLAAFASLASGQILINEIRTDNTGTDTDEYFELVGPANTPLTGYTYVVLGDGSSSSNSGGCSGVIESFADLSSFSIQADGYFAARNSAATPVLTGYDASIALAFENTDNVTHLLVTGFTGSLTQDLDTNDDGVLDVTPWTSIVDSIGLSKGTAYNCPVSGANEEYLYTPNVVGPDGSFVPGMVRRCSTGLVIGPFGSLTIDTPGAVNNCTVAVASAPWSQVKVLFR